MPIPCVIYQNLGVAVARRCASYKCSSPCTEALGWRWHVDALSTKLVAPRRPLGVSVARRCPVYQGSSPFTETLGVAVARRVLYLRGFVAPESSVFFVEWKRCSTISEDSPPHSHRSMSALVGKGRGRGNHNSTLGDHTGGSADCACLFHRTVALCDLVPA